MRSRPTTRLADQHLQATARVAHKSGIEPMTSRGSLFDRGWPLPILLMAASTVATAVFPAYRAVSLTVRVRPCVPLSRP